MGSGNSLHENEERPGQGGLEERVDLIRREAGRTRSARGSLRRNVKKRGGGGEAWMPVGAGNRVPYQPSL